jgi:D-aminopeptidase
MQALIRFVLGNYHPIILVNVQARVALVLLGFHALDQRSLSLASSFLYILFCMCS